MNVEPVRGDFLAADTVHSTPLYIIFERWARARPTRGFFLDCAARAAGVAKGRLPGGYRAFFGESLMSYFRSLRIERAVHLLKTSKRVSTRLPQKSDTRIAERCDSCCDGGSIVERGFLIVLRWIDPSD